MSIAAMFVAAGARAASCAARPVRVCRYFTAVPGDPAAGAVCATRNVAAAWLNVGAGYAQ